MNSYLFEELIKEIERRKQAERYQDQTEKLYQILIKKLEERDKIIEKFKKSDHSS